ncbi:uroporphyrinogen decarboxylase [Anaplasma capra]|uniref:uroporphyrinogen decarboxylase n=1 Tax=Anaplasma capra TaxID=1562740 RepID=UPI0021D591B5|nr:uroporphyrinogen decarboxylase [Anaplasma capra]MCU7611191.1 uroporphyrinogen decarboxylase [Anaplasma capra]MCU7612305.1 uroporphyrinogen decarboxylase [Anaplasma capra]
MFNSKKQSRVLERVLTQKKRQEKIPIWFMRQAGRYLPEYHKSMNGFHDFLEACYTPDIVEEITLQPIKRFDIDAAIIFSDIMVVPHALGYEIDFIRGSGPKVGGIFHQNSTDEAIKNLQPIFSGISRVRKSLSIDKTLIGFAGSPWTLATYILGKENNFFKIRKSRYYTDSNSTHEDEITQLINLLTDFTSHYLIKQIESGVDVIQLFDSSASVLPVELFEEFVILPTKRIVDSIHSKYPGFPIIGFPKGAGVMYKRYSDETGVSATSVDYSIPLTWISSNISGVVQGNLDPFLLAYNKELSKDHSLKIVKELGNKPLIFNLGHGILPETPIQNVEDLINSIRKISYDLQ